VCSLDDGGPGSASRILGKEAFESVATSCSKLDRAAIFARAPGRVRSHLGADFPLRKIRERLKCQICSSRKVTITFLGPHQKGGNMHYLFEKEPR
jgi:hypothetical protein